MSPALCVSSRRRSVSGAPDSSNWPPGSSDIAPLPGRADQSDHVALVEDRFPAERVTHAFEQRAPIRIPLRVNHASSGRVIVAGG